MSTGIPLIWPSVPLLRAFLATLALISQLTLGALPAQARIAASEAAQLDAVTILCHSQPTAPRHRHAPEQQTGSRLDLALELPAVVPTPPVLLPRPGLPITARPTGLPAARAPPARVASAPRARAPPSLA